MNNPMLNQMNNSMINQMNNQIMNQMVVMNHQMMKNVNNLGINWKIIKWIIKLKPKQLIFKWIMIIIPKIQYLTIKRQIHTLLMKKINLIWF